MSKESRDAAEGRPSYKDTLNLLQTGFGMRANAIKREPELQSFWNDNGIDLKPVSYTHLTLPTICRL